MKIKLSKHQWEFIGRKTDWIIADTVVKKINPEDIGGAMWDMVSNRIERETWWGKWNNRIIPYMIECANGIFNELSRFYFSNQYVIKKINTIKRYINDLSTIDIKKDYDQIQNLKKAISQLQPTTAQQKAVVYIMHAIADQNIEILKNNIEYLERWVKTMGQDKHPIQNKNEEPKY